MLRLRTRTGRVCGDDFVSNVASALRSPRRGGLRFSYLKPVPRHLDLHAVEEEFHLLRSNLKTLSDLGTGRNVSNLKKDVDRVRGTVYGFRLHVRSGDPSDTWGNDERLKTLRLRTRTGSVCGHDFVSNVEERTC